jgi:TPR repeat protein
LQTSAYYFKHAADQGNIQAQLNYSFCLANGSDVLMGLQKAMQYYKLAVDQENPAAQYRYVFLLSDSNGVASREDTRHGLHRISTDAYWGTDSVAAR